MIATQLSPSLVLEAKAELGESPVWDCRTGTLLWIDAPRGLIHVYDPLRGDDRIVRTGLFLGCVVPSVDGGVIAADRAGLNHVDLDLGMVTPLGPIAEHSPNVRLNDGIADPAGRMLVGSIDIDGREPLGALYQIDPGRRHSRRVLLKSLKVSNGMALSPDQRTLYHTDTASRRITAYAYDESDGSLTAPRVAVRTAWPDGIAIDAAGRLWVAHWHGSKVTVWDPDSGQLLRSIPIPAAHVTSCAFGGPDMCDLYITTARAAPDVPDVPDVPDAPDLPDPQDQQPYPFSGGLFRLRTDIPGLRTHSTHLSKTSMMEER